MSQKELPRNPSPEEIDLLAFLRKLIDGFGSCLNFTIKLIARFIIFAFRKWYFIAMAALLGVVIAYGTSRVLGRQFESEMTIRSNSLPVSEITSHISRLSRLIKEKNFAALDSLIPCGSQQVRNIKKIETFRVIDLRMDGFADYTDYRGDFNINDTLNEQMEDRFVLRITLKKADNLDAYSYGILEYINQNELFKELDNLRRDQLREKLARLEYDIVQLDSLQKVKYFEETRNTANLPSGQLIFVQEHQTQLIFDEIYLLYDKREILQKELKMYQQVCSVIEDFTPVIKSKTGTLYYSWYFVPSVIGLVLILLSIQANSKEINRWIYNKE